ncbi:Methyltransferase domain-containing protein [Prosthecobacter debontii]|uniref:Methyltransferase domain-containing protein n=1 Tax=Prosthecobacter debontii TaxID=48467 RepID=A0A1T4XGM9_9BACT|nr:class I SAM-dependent methyltransferase [Prosthecobacter debontii]SKA88684.1 Methyltransferase domain-containing protein [Prosthecobacter debontii]
MKDIVDNRRHITLGKKLSLAALILKENGPVWCGAFATYYAASALGSKAFKLMDHIRRKDGVPGMNSRALNKAIWEAWDWQAGGEEWTPNEAWKTAIIEHILRGYLPQGGHFLEIGPGGGRWTGELIQRADSLLGVDISASCVEVCTEKFAGTGKAKFIVGSGHDLAGVADRSLDALWSFDVFVHINQAEVERYADEFKRVFKPGAVGIIHHGTLGGSLGGWRSNLTHEAMLELLKKRGFEIVASFKEFTHDGVTHQTGLYEDAVTVFRLPA